MRIQDFESRSGLERATIRYYEKEGLLSPQRTENGYRDYSEADLEEVKKIKLLRQLGMPLDRIRELQQGVGNFTEAIDIQMGVLNDRAETQQWAREVCREIKRSEVDYPTLDADKYLNMLLTPPPPKPPKKPETHREILRLDHHPGRRFFARYLDLLLLYVFSLFLIVVVLRVRENLMLWLRMLDVAVWWVMIPLEALMLTLFGTTPGKLIFGIRLKYHPGGRFPFRTALRRSWGVFRYGMGWNLPFYSLYRLYKSYAECDEYPDMLWDDETDVSYRMWSYKEFGSIAASVFLMILMFSAVYDDILLPKHRDNLTISEFSDNYNFYASILDVPYRLNPDGTWVDDPSTGGDHLTDFTYTLENGYITAIHQDSEERGFRYLDPLHSYQTTAFVAFSAAQPIHDTGRILQLIEYWQDKAWYYKGDSFDNVIYGAVRFHWEIEYENCAFNEAVLNSHLAATNQPENWKDPTDAYLHIIMTIEIDRE